MEDVTRWLGNGGFELLVVVGGFVAGLFVKKSSRASRAAKIAQEAFHAVEGLARAGGLRGTEKYTRWVDLFTRGMQANGMGKPSGAELKSFGAAVERWAAAQKASHYP